MTQVSIIDVSQSVVDDSKKATPSWFTFWHDLWVAVRGGYNMSLGGTLSVDTSVKNNSSSTETTLMSYSIMPNLMANNGDAIDLKAWGTFAANANNKTIQLKFGSQTLLTTGPIAANSGSWVINATILRTSPTTQEIEASIISSNASVIDSVTRTAGTSILTNANNLFITAQGSSSNDITQYAMRINFTPNI